MEEDKTVSLDRVRQKLALLWLIATGIIFVIVIAETMLGAIDQGHAQSVWSWLLPTLMPTVGMIVATLSGSAFQSSASTATVRKSFYSLALAVSGLYLFLIFASILFRQSIAADIEAWLTKLHTSNLWLGPLQGVVALILGALFTSAKQKTPANQPAT